MVLQIIRLKTNKCFIGIYKYQKTFTFSRAATVKLGLDKNQYVQFAKDEFGSLYIRTIDREQPFAVKVNRRDRVFNLRCPELIQRIDFGSEMSIRCSLVEHENGYFHLEGLKINWEE